MATRMTESNKHGDLYPEVLRWPAKVWIAIAVAIIIIAFVAISTSNQRAPYVAPQVNGSAVPTAPVPAVNPGQPPK